MNYGSGDTAHVIALGAGVQSTVLLLMADQGLIKPLPRAAIFADTRWEPTPVYQHLEWLEQTVHNIPIIRVNEQRDLYREAHDGITKSGRPDTIIPAYVTQRDERSRLVASRECTREYKVRPIARRIAHLMGRQPYTRGNEPSATQWLGISTDEILRVKPSGTSWIINRWPLVEIGMSRHDCSRWFEANYPGQPITKSSCVGCAFHSNAEWLRLDREIPEQMEAVYCLDERLRSPDRPTGNLQSELYLHRTRRPLREAIARLHAQAAANPRLDLQDGFINECEGHCGV